MVGVQGAGLTLLTRMLHRNENIVTIGGGRAFWTGLNEMDKHCIRELPDALTMSSPGFQSPTFKDHRSRCGEDHEVFGLMRSWTYATDALIDRYRNTEDDYTAEIDATVRKGIKESLRAYATDLGRARFLDMSQTFSLKLPLLRKIFPDAKIVVQARDPYVLCWREATHDNYHYWNETPSFDRRLELAAQQWRNTYRTILNDLDAQGIKAITVRFEELIENPEAELRRVTDHVEIGYDDDMIPRAHHSLPLGSGEGSKWYPIRKDVNEKYEKEMTNEARSVLERVLGEVAGEFGYER
jgi:hypothetical protein